MVILRLLLATVNCTGIQKRGRKPGHKTLWPGVVADAKSLGVKATYLCHVLRGDVPRKSLLARYKVLKSTQEPAANVVASTFLPPNHEKHQ